MLRPAVAAALAALSLLALASPRAVHAQAVTTLRVMLHPSAAPGGTLPDEARARLEALVGGQVRVIGSTRTGALDLAVDAARSPYSLNALLARIRADRAVLWAETPPTQSSLRAARAKAASGPKGRKLMVRLADSTRSIDDALAAWSSRTGIALRATRTLPDALPVTADVYAVQTKEGLEAAVKASKGPDDLRVYLGYCGWTMPQLQNEVKLGGWYIFDHGERFAFDSAPGTLWKRLIDRTEGHFAFAPRFAGCGAAVCR